MSSDQSADSASPSNGHASLSTPQELYNSLFAGNKVTLRCDFSTYESLRVTLSRLHQHSRILELSDDSVCGSYVAGEAIGTFWLGARRKKQRGGTFEIVTIEAPKSSGDLL